MHEIERQELAGILGVTLRDSRVDADTRHRLRLTRGAEFLVCAGEPAAHQKAPKFDKRIGLC